jgi:hypothetical protein
MVTILYVLYEKGIQLINIDHKESWREMTTSWDLYGAPNEVREVMGDAKTTKHQVL